MLRARVLITIFGLDKEAEILTLLTDPIFKDDNSPDWTLLSAGMAALKGAWLDQAQILQVLRGQLPAGLSTAAHFLREGLESAEVRFGKASRERFLIAYEFGCFLGLLRRNDEAIPLLIDCAFDEKHTGPFATRAKWTALNYLAYVQSALGNYKEAVDAFDTLFGRLRAAAVGYDTIVQDRPKLFAGIVARFHSVMNKWAQQNPENASSSKEFAFVREHHPIPETNDQPGVGEIGLFADDPLIPGGWEGLLSKGKPSAF